jgi:prepilin-type processing-associated H-X9-DG protein
MMYVQDYDEVFFPRCTGTWSSTAWRDDPNSNPWFYYTEAVPGLVYPYINNAQVFVCPSESNRRGYGYSIILGYVALAKIEKPAEKIMFADDTFGSAILYRPSQGVLNWGANFVNPPGSTGDNIVWGENCPYGRHNEQVNVAFCDGHAKSMKPLELWADGTNKYYDPGA